MRRLVVLGVLAILGVVLVPSAPAAAHGGKVKLEVAGDGATGVTVRALYQSDGHPVEDRVLRLLLTAKGEGGKSVGPLDLEAAPEGRAFYRTSGVLTPGRWTVTVTGTDPNVIATESTVDARAQQAAPPPPTGAPPTTGPAERTGATERSGGGGGGGWWTIAFVVALAAAGAAILMVRQRGTRPAGVPAGRPGTTGRPRRGSGSR
ncbi:hypothetical protein GCM10009557_33770 [Virgisporangium ochraceum]|uniref:YtkA-like domain-containing protein n=1 Tax=Virgisporangium ochraceum TaxID=65505 RepID=A0A8J3ZU45_9ACTN|nr:hypothetical protein [Virgisporangium ochraceum]GIJ69676.1 hypothetical protein Voc01_045930 [Virgisporangium ochraceum]